MKLVKEVAFGRAIAKITVEKVVIEREEIPFVQMASREEEIRTKVEIIANGKVVTACTGAVATNDRDYYSSRFKNTDEEYITIVGEATTAGREVADNINGIIKKMKEEITGEIEEDKEIETAKSIVAQAEKEGIENLMTETDLKEWKNGYNNIMNEGGEGYLPYKVSKEDYEKALKKLEGVN